MLSERLPGAARIFVGSIFTIWRKPMHKGNVIELQKDLKEASAHLVRQDARVTVIGYFYAVDYGNGVNFGQHRVGKDRRCTCSLGTACPAIQAVVDYLKAGGKRAPDPPPGY